MIENLRLSFQGIFSHKMRSFLTMLGIIIGIAAIIAIVSTIKGTNDEIKNSLIGAGDNVVKVSLTQGGMEVMVDEADTSKVPIINDEMMTAIKELPTIMDAAKYHKASSMGGINHGNNQTSGTYVIGCDNDFINLSRYEIIKGRLFTDKDFSKFRRVVILDAATAYLLFQGEEPIGKTVEISSNPFTVVGIVEKIEDSDTINIDTPEDWFTYYGDSGSGYIFLPDSIWPLVYSYDQPYQLIVKANTTEDMTEAGKSAQDYLNSFISSTLTRRGASGSDSSEEDMEYEDDEDMEMEGDDMDSESDSYGEDGVKYKSENTLEKAKELQKLKSSTSKQLIYIASISLLVGGIGVMNIMLVSVTERTREIGLKKAIGARKSAVLSQFLTEAAVLTSLGGMLGVLAGIGLSYFISKVADVPVAISVPAILVSVLFSMVIGIVFGLLPSIKAANLNPIDALRYE